MRCVVDGCGKRADIMVPKSHCATACAHVDGDVPLCARHALKVYEPASQPVMVIEVESRAEEESIAE